jgi:beta-galactosidase
MPLDHQTAKGCRTIAWLAVLMSAVWLTGASATAGFGRPAQRQNPRVPANAGGEARSRITINQKWKFLAEDASGAEQLQFKDERWQEIDLPHTWNKEDTKDDVAGYRRGIGWYRKVINLPQQLKNRKVFLYFEGANQVADVFVNGRSVGRHQGGYTAFIFDISGFVEFDSAGNRNLIAVKVDNSINDDLPPSATADFNLYGGIYRDVWLVTTDPVHFSTTDYASPGIYVDTPEVSAEKARVRIRGTVTNDSDQAQELRVVNTVTDSAGQVVAVTESNLSIAAGAASTFHQITQEIRAPHLWSPETPYLYNSRTQLLRREKTVDEISHSVGIRWFSFDPNQGFSLNGKPYKLRGANRHQDYFGVGNALDDSMHVKDLEAIKDLGLNCVLLAHYPQDPVVLETADRVGLFVWEEIPIVREISTSKEFANNCQVMLTEMIRQHYNHPSIIMWCLMNEIFLRLRTEPGYVPKVVALARALDRLARTEDPTRVTVISANRPSQGDIYNASGLLSIPQVVAWHMYFGWYYGEFAGFGRFVDEEHRRFAQRILFVSEYGADNDARIHSLNPRRGDLSSEWALLYHESYLDQIEARSYLAGAAVWAENDFGSEARGEPLPHVNTKGLLTFNRKPKDVYYLYKAIYSLDPVLRIATHDWLRRTGVPARAEEQGSNRTVVQAVEVYSNLSTVELFATKSHWAVNRSARNGESPGRCRSSTV